MEEIEEFRDIVGYEGLYQISNLGRVKSLEKYKDHPFGTKSLLKEKILKKCIDKSGYFCICLSKNKKPKTYQIHKLLYIAYYGIYDSKYYQVDHINRIKNDNILENLRLVSIRNNSNNRTDQSEFGVGVRKKRK